MFCETFYYNQQISGTDAFEGSDIFSIAGQNHNILLVRKFFSVEPRAFLTVS